VIRKPKRKEPVKVGPNPAAGGTRSGVNWSASSGERSTFDRFRAKEESKNGVPAGVIPSIRCDTLGQGEGLRR